MRRFLALMLVCACVLGLMPSVLATEGPSEPTPLTQEDYLTADLIWDSVYSKESELRSKRAPVSTIIEALITQVTASPYYAEGSLIRRGDHFFWETTEGIPCGYSPRLAEIGRQAESMEGYDPSSAETVLTTSYEAKGGRPGGKDVFLIQPYYGIDADFTRQYELEANAIAQATGGTATLYRTTSATIDAIADSIEAGAVVLFDSHGDTDYSAGDDYTSRANSSYICLQTGEGLTSEDYELATGPFGEYYHAFYGGSYGSMKYYCVDGTAISNHMDKDADNSILWMALCLSMATDGLQAPLRSRGVEVAYGYSQSVTFEYDYRWEEIFWEDMLLGKTVAEAVDRMKTEVGLWDWCHSAGYDTIEEARATYSAFPIVVSGEDVYPGHGKVDDLQTVRSTWTLLSPCDHGEIHYIEASSPTCTEDGNIAYYLCTLCNGLFRDEALTERLLLKETILEATGHSYDEGQTTTAPGCTTDGVLTYTCADCGHSYTELLPMLGHEYVDGYCTLCGKERPYAVDFTIGSSGVYVLAANVNGVYYAMPNSYTATSGKLSGVQIDGSQGFIEEELAADFALTLTYDAETGKYTIFNGTYYLRYPSSTNLGGITSPYYWTIEPGVNGSWKLISQTSSRGLVYRASGYNCFGGYYRPNVTSGGREYFDIEILPVGGTSSEAPTCQHSSTEQKMVPATCTEEGTLDLLCKDCGALLHHQVLAPNGHTWLPGEVLTQPTCEGEGLQAYYCQFCTETKTESVAPTGHSWDGGMVTAEPTCSAEGILTYTCSLCSATYTEEIPTLSHTWDEGKVTTEPSCTETGVMTYECVVCHTTYTEDTPAKGHTWDQGTLTTAPTCTMEGVMTYICIYCTATVTEEVPTIDHRMENGVCTLCGYTDDPQEPEGSDVILDESIVINHSLNLASDISINYVVLSSLLEGYDTFTLHCQVPVYEGEDLVDYETVAVEPVKNGYFYYFTLTGITAVQMGDSIRSTLYLTKEDVQYCSKTDEYSVADYAYGQLRKETSAPALKTLCAQLLRYGSYAQQFKSYRTESLADGAMTSEEKAYLNALDEVSFSSNNKVLEDLQDPTVTWAGKTLNLESKVVLRFIADLSKYEGDPEELSLRVSYRNYKSEDVELVLPAPRLYVEELKYYTFDLDTLLAAELRTVVSAAVYCGETQVSPTVQYSPDAYGIGKSGTLLSLCRALIAYSDTALAYFTQQ